MPLNDSRAEAGEESRHRFEPTPAACRPGCGACCIAPSISTLRKPAGEACGHLTPDLRCAIFGRPERPACCSGLQPAAEMCGNTREQALAWLADLERRTATA